ncbi:Structure-specific endonuclease subunit SLX4 [Cytospora mali]|uniref:Structure-specific endonuclease subunit SLX4 n=1 Tax=Cytospora mali TaxID=578113 RepID=A0A194VFP6_CYTMA|nr:Structure-specific endonuclease subunit SLX4 [Valsa mali var. pyri (nom. inval.)]
MAAHNLRSSPARPTLHDRLMMLSSSPDLPDLKDLIAKKPKPPTLRSGSAAAPLPANATTTFTTAADLLRTGQANGEDALATIDEPERPPVKKAPVKRARKSTKAPKRVAKEVVVLSSDGVAPKVDKETTTETGKTDGKGCEGSTLAEKPWKRFKAPVELEGTNQETLAPAAEIVEAIKPPERTRAQKKKTSKPETISKHFVQKDVAQEKAAKASTPEPLNLEPAVQRRTDWTPPRADTTYEEIDPSDLSLVVSQVEEREKTTDKIEIFKNLHDAYGHKATDIESASTKQQAATVLGKRKVIGMISMKQASKIKDDRRDPSPVKEKAPKKKPRTITELATAAYIPKAVELEDALRAEDSIVEYFAIDNEEQGTSNASTSKAKGKGKAAKVSKITKKKAPPKQAILLSPEAALRQSAGQDFVFGTSSQLAREQSPNFLKDLHTALRASNNEGGLLANRPVQAEGTRPKKPSRGLWSQSARDEDGELVDVEIIDLVDSSCFPNDDSIAILNPWKDLPPEPNESNIADSSLVELGSKPVPADRGESSQSPLPKPHFFLSQHKITVNSANATSLESSSRPSFPLITNLMEEEAPPPSNQQQSQDEVRTVSSITKTNPTQKPRPKYELFTDAKLAKEVSSFGFKAIKTRSAMIALLDQCWKSKNQAPIAGLSFSTSSLAGSPKGKTTAPTTVSSASTSPVPTKPRGRPKKTTTAGNSNVSAAAGPESPASPAKKRGRPRKDAVTTAKTTRTSTPSPPKSRAKISTPKRKKAAPGRTSALSGSDVDSEAGLTSSEQIFSSPLAIDLSNSEDTEISLTLSPTMQQSALFSHITKAVTSAPRTADPENPSWQEKMLMFDPVILEDLTVWLNSGQLTQVGYDGEVAPADVKKWCESKSVCCLWKVNHQGKERKRF